MMTNMRENPGKQPNKVIKLLAGVACSLKIVKVERGQVVRFAKKLVVVEQFEFIERVCKRRAW